MGGEPWPGRLVLGNPTGLYPRPTKIVEKGAKGLAVSRYLVGLKRLKLHGNAIGPDGASALKSRFGEACLLPRLQGSGQSRPGDWHCFECGATNFSNRDVCYECRGPRPRPLLRAGDWVCP